MATFNKELDGINGVLEELSRARSGLTLQHLQTLFTVARWPGISMIELSQRLGMPQASVVRNVGTLGDWEKIGVAGLGYIESVPDPEYRKRKILFLTRKGADFMGKLMARLSPDREPEEFPLMTPKQHAARIIAKAAERK